MFQCYSIVKIQFKNFYLTIFIALDTNILNKTIKNFTLAIIRTVNIQKHTCLKTSEVENDNKKNVAKGNRANKGQFTRTKK